MKKTGLITAEIIKRLKDIGVKAQKSLGQNFLVNEGVYQKIIAAAQIKPTDTIIEVGPGLGILTEHLANAAGRLIAVEKDRRLARYLRKKFQNNPRVEIVESDILKFTPRHYSLQTTHYKLAGNLPYYLTSRLLKTALEEWPLPHLAVFMLQKEVAQRIVAKPPHMSLLAVSVQYFSEPEIISYVSKGSFYPVPKVDSAIVRLMTKDQGLKPKTEREKFFKVVKAGFAGKRKQLVNNLATVFKIPKAETEKKLLAAGIAPSRRAETLNLAEWAKLAKILAKSA